MTSWAMYDEVAALEPAIRLLWQVGLALVGAAIITRLTMNIAGEP